MIVNSELYTYVRSETVTLTILREREDDESQVEDQLLKVGRPAGDDHHHHHLHHCHHHHHHLKVGRPAGEDRVYQNLAFHR